MSYHGQTILLVEEEPILREITSFRLELLGYHVVCCQDANEADHWLTEQLPDLALIGMVGSSNSLEFLDHLSNDPRTSEIPVIYLSASSDLADVQKAFNAGADEFLVTPFDPLVLENKVGGLLATSQSQQ